MRLKRFVPAAVVLSLAAACASPEVIETDKVGDAQLSCSELSDQIAEAKRFEKDARDKRGVTGTNVAAAVLFWPALLVTYANTDEAIDAAKERQRKLTDLADKRTCPA